MAHCADLDGDGTVGIIDLHALLANWGTDPGGPPDFDGDGDQLTAWHHCLSCGWCFLETNMQIARDPCPMSQEYHPQQSHAQHLNRFFNGFREVAQRGVGRMPKALAREVFQIKGIGNQGIKIPRMISLQPLNEIETYRQDKA